MPSNSDSGIYLPDVDQVGWGDAYNDGQLAHELHAIHRNLNTDIHHLDYYLDAIDGDDDFDDGIRGWDRTRPAKTVAQMMTDVTAAWNGTRVVVRVKGANAKIYDMLADPTNNYVYPTGAIQLLKNMAIIGGGGDVRSDAASSLFVDDGTSSADNKPLISLGRYSYVEDIVVVNRRPGGEGYAQSQQAVGSVIHNSHAWGCQMSGFVSESNANDYAIRLRCKAYKNGGYGHEARDTVSLDAPNQQRDLDCDYTQNALGGVHLMATRTTDTTSGNGYYGAGIRMHGGPGLNGYWHNEGWHNSRLDECYIEGAPTSSPDTPLMTIRAARLINAPVWVASRAYKVGDVVTGTATSGLGSRLYFECTVAGTASSTEPDWMGYSLVGRTFGGGASDLTAVVGPGWDAGDVGKPIAITQGFVTTIATRVSQTAITVTDAVPGGTIKSEVAIWSDALLVGGTLTDGGVTWKRIHHGAPRARANVTAYSLGQIIYPTTYPATTTKIYYCTTAGTSHTSQPGAYGTNATGPITDGTAAFTAIGIGSVYYARAVSFAHNDIHGSDIAPASNAGLARLLDVDWCKRLLWEPTNDYRGGFEPDTDNPMFSFGSFAHGYDTFAAFRSDSGALALASQDEALLEAVPGRGRGEWFDGNVWQPINAGAGGIGTDAFWSAKGDIAGGTANDTAAVLPVGVDGKVLTADSGVATGFSWQDAPAAGTGDVATDAIWDTLGDLAVGTGADTAAVLPIGADGTGLVADSGETTGARWGIITPFRTITDLVGGDVVVYSASGQLIATDPDPGTAISLALADGEGDHFVRQGIYQLANTSPIVGQNGVTLVLESAAAQHDSATLYGGAIIKGPASVDMDDGWLINGLDCEGFVVKGGALDCNAHSDYGVVFAGFRAGYIDPIVVKQKVAGILFSENGSSTHDAYADMFVTGKGYMYGNGAVYGVLVDDLGGVNSQPTDGSIMGDIRLYGCHSGAVRVTKGGWTLDGPRVVGNTTSTAGVYMAGGTIGTITIDSVGNGPSLEIDGSAIQVGIVKILLAGSGSEVALVEVTSGNVLDIGSIMVNDPAAGSFSYDYILHFAATPASRATKWSRLMWKAQAPNTAVCNYMSNLSGYEVGFSGGHS